MLKNNEPANKLAHYSNIQASVEKLTDERTKQQVIEAINSLSDEELRKIDGRSEVLDKILKGIEYFNINNKESEYSKQAIHEVINLFSKGSYDRLINVNSSVLQLFIKHYFHYNENNKASIYSNLNDDKFSCLAQSYDLCKILLATRTMDNFIRISYGDHVINNESFRRCISNQGLILIYCVGYMRHNSIYGLKKLMLCPDRNSMIDKLYELQQENKLYCDEKSLDLILLNLPIVEQLLYNDIDGSVIETLQSGSDEEIKTLLESVQESIKLKYDKYTQYTLYIPFIKSPDQSKVHEKDVLYNPRDLSLLQTFSAAKLMENNYALLSTDNVNAFHKVFTARTIEAQEKQREAKLANPQATSAIPNEQNIAQQ